MLTAQPQKTTRVIKSNKVDNVPSASKLLNKTKTTSLAITFLMLSVIAIPTNNNIEKHKCMKISIYL